MLNRHEAHVELNTPSREPALDAAPTQDRLLADREVPLPGTASADTTASVVQQWLDGEASEAEARRADGPAVDFWKRLDVDTDRLRRMKTPTHVAASILAALPVRER
jgi:hypothetical protein